MVVEVLAADVQPVAETVRVLGVVFAESTQFEQAQLVPISQLVPALLELISTNCQQVLDQLLCDLLPVLVAYVRGRLIICQPEGFFYKSGTVPDWLVLQVIKDEFS